jgi:hypothetical protein
MHMPAIVDSFVLQQVFKMRLLELNTEKLLANMIKVKNASIETTADESEARGGVGNYVIESFSYNKAATFTCESAVFSTDSLAAQLGLSPTVGAGTYYYTDVFTATSETSATLTKTPSTAPNYIYKYNPATNTKGIEYTKVADTPDATEFTISTKTVTFGTGSGLTSGDTLIAVYLVATPTTSVKITNRADLFGKTVKLILDGLVRQNGVDYACQVVAENFKIADNLTLSTTSDGEPSVHNMSGKLLASAGTTPTLWTLTILDETAVV